MKVFALKGLLTDSQSFHTPQKVEMNKNEWKTFVVKQPDVQLNLDILGNFSNTKIMIEWSDKNFILIKYIPHVSLISVLNSILATVLH